MDKTITIIPVPGMFSLGDVFGEIARDLRDMGWIVRNVDFPMKISPNGDYVYSGPCETDFWQKLEYLLKIIRSVNGPYCLVGHSAGAALVLKASAEPGINPVRIFLISPAPVYGIFCIYPSVVRSFYFALRQWNFQHKSIFMPYKNFRWAMAHTLTEDQARKVYQLTREECGMLISQIGFWFNDSDESTKVDFRKIKPPIHMAVGNVDRITPIIFAKTIERMGNFQQERFLEDSRITLDVLSGCSHWLLVERFQWIVKWIDDLLTEDPGCDIIEPRNKDLLKILRRWL